MLKFEGHTASPLDDTRDRATRAVRALMATTNGRNPVVLVLQREAFVGRRVHRLLGRAGCRTILSDDHEDALQLLEQPDHDVDLVIVDLRDGDEFGNGDGKLQAALRRPRRTPVLLLSDPAREHGDGPGHPFLRKPFGPTDLLESVATLLGRRGPFV